MTTKKELRSVAIGDAEYLKVMSGYKQKKAIAGWCRGNKIKFFLNGQGWPVTTQGALDQALLGGGVESGPDWSAFAPNPNSTHWRHRRRLGGQAPTAQSGAPRATVKPSSKAKK